MARNERKRPRWVLLAVLAIIAAACAAADDPGAGATVNQAADTSEADTTGNTETTASTETTNGSVSTSSTVAEGEPPPFPWEAANPEEIPASVPLEEIRRGGPPPDGIPSIDDPQFESVDAALEWLTERDPVMVVDMGDEPRAYPLAILTFHEIVNDEIAGEPVLVTYCPLCNSGLVFERTVDGEVLEFGTSGRLWNSNLVMYDRATRNLWSQYTGEAIVGEEWLGTSLVQIPMQIVSLAEYAERWPDGMVLSRETGHSRPYGSNPYAGYDSAQSPFLYDGETSDVLPEMARVVATGGDTDPVAIEWDTLTEARVISVTVNDDPLVVFWAPGNASALDSAEISEGEDVGMTGVFRPVVDGETLTFVPDGDQFRDEQTSSTWTVLGESVAGELEGQKLERVLHDDTFWFVQYAFRPDTRVVDGS